MRSPRTCRMRHVHATYYELLAIPRAREHPRLRTWAEQAVAWAHVTAGSPERALEHTDRGIALEGEWPSMTHFQPRIIRPQLPQIGRTNVQELALWARDFPHRAPAE